MTREDAGHILLGVAIIGVCIAFIAMGVAAIMWATEIIPLSLAIKIAATGWGILMLMPILATAARILIEF